MIPADILDLILSFHMAVCCEEFIGHPNYLLYWVYDKGALRQILGMTKDEYKLVHSKLGKFMRRVPETNTWLTTQTGGWALKTQDLYVGTEIVDTQ